jgi:ATPase subunit of ABC transporter with duplicated ATPase domains
LILDEPTNDLDTDMLAQVEDLLDSWPGTLIVVSHDRYLLERVTDMQYALLGDGALRHLPRGVDQYLELRGAAGKVASQQAAPKVSGAELRASQKIIQKLERAIEKLDAEEIELGLKLQSHDPLDHEGLAAIALNVKQLATQKGVLESRWMELSERI